MNVPLPLAMLQEQAPTGGGSMWIMLLGMVAIFWFVAIAPERKERKRKQEMINELKKNDRVITTSGMYASVAAVNEQDLTLKFDEGPTRVRVLKSAIATVLNKDESEDGSGS